MNRCWTVRIVMGSLPGRINCYWAVSIVIETVSRYLSLESLQFLQECKCYVNVRM